jgi:uncharacterized membrane protein YfcA
MEFFSGSNDLGTLGLGLLIAGTAAGLFSGMLGSGGGLILVPVLYHVLGALGVSEAVRLHLAAGTALAALLPMTLASANAEWNAKAVDVALLKRWSAPLLVGVIGGAAVGTRLPVAWLAILFAAVATVVALLMLLGKERWRLCDSPPRGVGGQILSFAVGAIAMLMGIGGASLMTPVLRLSGSARASGTASAFAAIICTIGALASVVMGWGVYGLPNYSYGYVNLMGFGIVAPVMYGASRIAFHYAGDVEAKRPRASFALFVILIAGKMVWDVMGG